MKIIALCLLLFIESFVWTQGQAQAQTTKPKVLIYADDGYPPYSFGTKETNFSDGIYIRIVSKIFDQMKDDYDITLLAAPWQRAIDATKTGVAFAVLPPYSNPKKRPWLSQG